MTSDEGFRLERASPEMQPLLASLLELYSHDLSDIFPIQVGADGRFGYDKLPLYWSEPGRRFPFLFRRHGRVAGFALVTRGSPATGDPSDLDVAEFFVLRGHRRHGVGRQAAVALWTSLPGHWIVRVSEDNRPALPFWADVIGHYTGGRFEERTTSIDGHRWRVFSFHTRV